MTAAPTRPTVEQMLAFEAAHPDQRPTREEAIRAEFGIPPARYYQLLNRAIDTEHALSLDPILVYRLRRLRDRNLRL